MRGLFIASMSRSSIHMCERIQCLRIIIIFFLKTIIKKCRILIYTHVCIACGIQCCINLEQVQNNCQIRTIFN